MNKDENMNKVYSDASMKIAMDMLQTDMRINDARLSDAMEHEEGLRALHEAAKKRVSFLQKNELYLQARLDSISLNSHPVIGVNCDINGNPFSLPL